MAAGNEPMLEQRIAKALAHPLRQRILARLNDEGVLSPNELSQRLSEPLGNVSYHMRILRDFEFVELVRTEPRRGALEHYYRPLVRPVFEDEDWAALPASLRGQLLGQSLEDIWTDVTAAIRAGSFDVPKSHLSRTPLSLDATAKDELAAAVDRLVELALHLQAAAAERHKEDGSLAMEDVELALLFFGRAPAETD
jgi:DNA-binding transcriptional ArsR family regulator